MASAALTAGVDIRHGPVDDEWDDFVDRVRGGHHVQSSRWGAVKASVGWRATRVVVRDGRDIVGGCQLLERHLGPLRVGYVPRGPLGTEDRAVAAALDALDGLAARRHLLYLKVQPASDAPDVADSLRRRRFVRSALAAGPGATVRVDIRQSDDTLLAAMRQGTRANIAKAARRGITVREGGEDDLASFARLVEATSRRQGFRPYPPAYYAAAWQAFGRSGRARLLLAEHGDELLSALLLLGTGDTLSYKMGGWSGEHRDLHPNEAAHWWAMRLARDAGYRYYDFDDIDADVAVALRAGQEVPVAARPGLTHFKLGFGGEVVVLSPSFDRSYLPGASAAVRRLAPNADRLERVVRRISGRR